MGNRALKISIVIPSYNQAEFVAAALESVIRQDYPNKEILFVDGASTDHTMRVVESYRKHISVVISERDKGQSDALRKGFECASGQVFTWLNTDDLMLPGTLREVAETMTPADNCSWALGNVVWIDINDQILRCWRGESYARWASPRHGLLAAGGPSAFFARELYERVGGVNLDLHYQMDTELWWRFSMSGAEFRRLKGYNWALRLHPAAKVSGHMFADPSDPVQQKIAAMQDTEFAHILALTQAYRLPIPTWVAGGLKVAHRLMSPAYLRGQFENRLWKGRHLGELLEATCSGGR